MLAETITIENSTCLLSIYYVTDETSKTVSWDGRALLRHCRIGFSLPDKDEYKVIIDVEQFQVEDCHFQLLYFYGDTSVAKQVIALFHIHICTCDISPLVSTEREILRSYIFTVTNTSAAYKKTDG